MDTSSPSTSRHHQPQDADNDRLSIKNLLFTKAVPNYVIPISTAGYRVYACIDCGDKFILEKSYKHHVNRKSAMISYYCRYCSKMKTFYNRCNMLSHIRSHAFKTATINITDLKIEPLPMSFYNIRYSPSPVREKQINQNDNQGNNKTSKSSLCNECQTPIYTTESMPLSKARAQHMMQISKKVQTCVICLYVLPTTCALKAHMRLHLRYPPYHCPECGYLASKAVAYPYSHGCEGFKMMRATARIKCPVSGCQLLHPNEYREHIMKTHFKEVFKCNLCYLASFDEEVVNEHINKIHFDSSVRVSSFYQCELCTGRLVMSNQMYIHINEHVKSMVQVYPCWSCSGVCKDAESLIEHYTSAHDKDFWNIYCSIMPPARKALCNSKNYRVVKKCGQCKRSFTYKCKYEQIAGLPNECPYKCTLKSGSMHPESNSSEDQIVCPLCKNRISSEWELIKHHFNDHHCNEHRCIDVKVVIQEQNIEKYVKIKTQKKIKRLGNKRNMQKYKRKSASCKLKDSIDKNDYLFVGVNAFQCKKCGHQSDNQKLYEKHLIDHRDLCMAYQCMECGQCFVVKPSFSKHLVIEHNIVNVDNYIAEKDCYNESALVKYQEVTVLNEPLLENQCTICREQFENSSDLEKHFRVHGMAFLKKNNKTNSP